MVSVEDCARFRVLLRVFGGDLGIEVAALGIIEDLRGIVKQYNNLDPCRWVVD